MDDEAKKEGRTHIGFGIFHDYEKGLNALTADEKKRIKTAVTPAEKIEAGRLFSPSLRERCMNRTQGGVRKRGAQE